MVVKSPSVSDSVWTAACDAMDGEPVWAFLGTLASLSPLVGCPEVAVDACFFALEESIDGADELLAAGAQLTDAVLGDLLEEAFASREQGNQYTAAIVTAAATAHVAARLKTVDEFDGAVVLESEALGERLDGGFAALWKTADSEKHQILLRLETDGAGLGIAFSQKMADAVAELGKGAVFSWSDVRHDISISYCDISRQSGQTPVS